LLGLATGALYAMVGLGIVLVYRASGVLNFSAGAVGGVSAYLFYVLRDEHGMNWIVALTLALVLGVVLGVLTQVLVMTVLRRASLVAKLIATLGIMASAQGVIAIIWGPESKGLPASIFSTNLVHLGGTLQIPQERLVIIGIVLVLAVALRALYSKTMFGLATSAVAESRRVAGSSGWSPTKIELANFAWRGCCRRARRFS
jgi:sulfate-transporting ATPase